MTNPGNDHNFASQRKQVAFTEKYVLQKRCECHNCYLNRQNVINRSTTKPKEQFFKLVGNLFGFFLGRVIKMDKSSTPLGTGMMGMMVWLYYWLLTFGEWRWTAMELIFMMDSVFCGKWWSLKQAFSFAEKITYLRLVFSKNGGGIFFAAPL